MQDCETLPNYERSRPGVGSRKEQMGGPQSSEISHTQSWKQSDSTISKYQRQWCSVYDYSMVLYNDVVTVVDTKLSMYPIASSPLRSSRPARMHLRYKGVIFEVVREVLNTCTPITLYYRSLVAPLGVCTGGAIDTQQRLVYCAVVLCTVVDAQSPVVCIGMRAASQCANRCAS